MKDELFQQLAASLKEGGAILRGKKKAARTTTLKSPDARAIRKKLGGPLELYDLSKDLSETTDVAVRHPNVIARMEWRDEAIFDGLMMNPIRLKKYFLGFL